MFDEKGYLRVTDFGIARIWNPENSKETSGTPGYMAPEVMCRQNHGVAVDYFAVGIIGYECMMGRVSNLIIISLHSDHTSERHARRSEITYSLNRYRSSGMRSLLVGQLRAQTS